VPAISAGDDNFAARDHGAKASRISGGRKAWCRPRRQSGSVARCEPGRLARRQSGIRGSCDRRE